MAPRQRIVTADQLRRKAVRLERRNDAKDEPAPTSVDNVKAAAPADRMATADEVREAGQRASTRWASLLQRLAE